MHLLISDEGSERAAIDLVACGEGQRVERDHRFGKLVVRELLRRESPDVGQRRRWPVGDHHDHADLAHHRIVPGHDSHRANRRMGREHALHLDGVHVVPTAYVHLLGAADEAEAAGVVDPTDVAGADVARRGERGPRCFRVVPVALHHALRAEAHRTDLTRGDWLVFLVENGQVDAGVGAADAHDGIFLGVVEGGAEPDPCLGAGVSG